MTKVNNRSDAQFFEFMKSIVGKNPIVFAGRQVDWDSALREDNGNINELGLYDLDRNIMPVGRAYQKLIQQWRDVLSEETYGLYFRH